MIRLIQLVFMSRHKEVREELFIRNWTEHRRVILVSHSHMEPRNMAHNIIAPYNHWFQKRHLDLLNL